jgi:hypothetical protein
MEIKSELNKKPEKTMQVILKPIKPRMGLIRSGTLFLAGVGFAGILCYSSLLSYIKRSDDNLKNELDSLKNIIEKQQTITIENNNKL